MKRVEMWKWWVTDDVTGKQRRTRYLMTEEVAHARHPGAIKVEGSLELREMASSAEEEERLLAERMRSRAT